MRPPVSVVVSRLCAGEAHRLPAIDKENRRFGAAMTQIIGGRDAGNSGTDNRYLDMFIRFGEY